MLAYLTKAHLAERNNLLNFKHILSTSSSLTESMYKYCMLNYRPNVYVYLYYVCNAECSIRVGYLVLNNKIIG